MPILFCTNCHTTWYIDSKEVDSYGLGIDLDKGEIPYCDVIGKTCIPTKVYRSVAELGSVLTGTIRTEDLMIAFTALLSELDTLSEYTWLVDECEQIISDQNWDSDETSYVLNESLWNALDSFSPNGAYFGVHPGDGPDFGYWVTDEWAEDQEGDYDYE